MKTKMSLNGTTRKSLVAAVAELTGEKAIYRANGKPILMGPVASGKAIVSGAGP